jgi:hypothetical protein
LSDPEKFFTDLGDQIRAEVTGLYPQIEASMLEQAGKKRDDYLQTAAIRMTARKVAEEIVMKSLVWEADTDLSLSEAREEWESIRPSDENLASWAARIQENPDLRVTLDELDDKARNWALTVEFLDGLLDSTNPWQYLTDHQSELREAAGVRFTRELA